MQSYMAQRYPLNPGAGGAPWLGQPVLSKGKGATPEREVNTAKVDMAATSARTQLWVRSTARQYFLCRLKVRGYNVHRTYPT